MAQRRIRTSHLTEGMIIKNDIYSNSGLVIVPANTTVTADIRRLLTRHFIEDVVVETGTLSSSNPFQPTFQTSIQRMEHFEKTFEIAEENLSQNLLNIINNNADIDTQLLLDSLNSIIQTADNDVDLCNMISSMQEKAKNLYTHSINVAIFSQILAKWIDCTNTEIELVSIAALLHDIGLLKCIPNNNATISFRDELFGINYERHVLHGYNLIKDKNIDSRIKQAVLTHHERIDQSGFPLQISTANINHISRILAIADTYDILTMGETSPTSMSQFGAIKYLEEHTYGKLDTHILITFLDKIAHTLLQHQVLLSNGEMGRVIMINKNNLSRPLVQIGSVFVDLSIRTDLLIKKVLE